LLTDAAATSTAQNPTQYALPIQVILCCCLLCRDPEIPVIAVAVAASATPENSTRKYYRTYLMVSPRGYHHAAAAQGGPAAAQKQVLSLLAMALDGSRTLEDRGAAAAHAADTLQCVAWFVIQAAEGASKQQQVGPHLDAESVLSLLKATAGQLHAAKKAADVVADGQSQLPVVVPGLPALVAALSQLVAALAMLPGFIGGKSGTQVGKKHQVSKKLKPHLTQLMELIPLVGEEAAAAGLRQAVTQLSSSRKEDCMFAIRAAAAWPGVRQQMSGALQLSAMPEQALKLLGSVPSLLESQQQQVFAGLAQALQHSNTRDQAVRAAIDLNSGVPSWKRHPHLQAQAAAAVLAAISHLPPARQQDACGALSWANWAQWEAPLQQQLLQAARQVTAALVGGPGQGRQQQRTMAYLCQRTQMMDKQLQRQVLEPYIAHMLADGGAFAAQKVEDCLALSNLLLELPQPMVALHQLFAAALLQRGDAQEVLQVLAAVGAMREPEVRGLPSVRQLLEARVSGSYGGWRQRRWCVVATVERRCLSVPGCMRIAVGVGWDKVAPLNVDIMGCTWTVRGSNVSWHVCVTSRLARPLSSHNQHNAPAADGVALPGAAEAGGRSAAAASGGAGSTAAVALAGVDPTKCGDQGQPAGGWEASHAHKVLRKHMLKFVLDRLAISCCIGAQHAVWQAVAC
jgi:hypothetical protein